MVTVNKLGINMKKFALTILFVFAAIAKVIADVGQ